MSSRRKKIITTTTAVVLTLALGLAGTFAASSSGDSPGNIEGQVDTSIFLHDDFSKSWDGDIMDRDVYVENTGDTSLYVRVRLDEFMTYGGKKLVGGDRDQKSTWKPHVPAGTNPEECGTEIHDYFTIQMGNDVGVKYKPKTKNAYNPAITDAEKTETTSAAEIILIEDYLKAEVKPGACWILDTADGYAYWHTRLQKGKATGLILNSITNTNLIDESYYYGINVKAEAVTETDLNAWIWGEAPKDTQTGEKFDQASTNAIRLLKNLSQKYIEITEEMAANGAGDYDSDNDGYLTKQENAQYEAEKGVTGTPAPDLTVSINSVNFPDSSLRNEIQTKDKNGDGELSKEEMKAVTSLDLSGTGITDYTGLEHFTELTDLNVSSNGLTKINFLSKTPKLTTLNASGNHLKSLDVSSVSGLTSVTADNQTIEEAVTYHADNNTYKSKAGEYAAGTTFTNADVTLNADGSVSVANMADGKTSNFGVPVTLHTKGINEVSGTITFTTKTDTWIDINSTNFPNAALRTAVQTKDTNSDGKLSEAEVKAAASLDLSGKTISDYTGLELLTSLTDLNVSNSNLTEVSFLNKTPNLTTLNCSNNNLTSLSLSKGALTKILEAVLKDSSSTQLTNVNCSNNELTALDLSSAPGLTDLNCSSNKLTKLDISGNALLTNITATGQTTTVDLTFDKSIWKYKGGSNLFADGTTFGAADAAYDSTTGGLTLTTLTDGKTSTYDLPLTYNGSQKGSLSGTITFTGTIYVNPVVQAVKNTAAGGTVQIADKDGSTTEWIVYNKTANEADLITKNTVGTRQYHASTPYPGWGNSDIRKWLNDGTSGYKSRLSDDMKGAIKAQNLTTASAYNVWTNPTQSTDEIYLLTETGSGSGKVGKTIGAAVTLTTEQLKSDKYWWLRSPSTNDGSAGYIYPSGEVKSGNADYAGGDVRPGITISLN